MVITFAYTDHGEMRRAHTTSQEPISIKPLQSSVSVLNAVKLLQIYSRCAPLSSLVTLKINTQHLWAL